MTPLTGNPNVAVAYARRANHDQVQRADDRRRALELRCAARARRHRIGWFH